MTNEPSQSEDFEDSLPDVEDVSFESNESSSEFNDTHGEGEEGAESESSNEPEGVFELFDSEFRNRPRVPIAREESSEFDREFEQYFERMFSRVKGEDSAPLFDGEEQAVELPEANGYEKPIAPEPDNRRIESPEEKDSSEVELEDPGVSAPSGGEIAEEALPGFEPDEGLLPLDLENGEAEEEHYPDVSPEPQEEDYGEESLLDLDEEDEENSESEEDSEIVLDQPLEEGEDLSVELPIEMDISLESSSSEIDSDDFSSLFLADESSEEETEHSEDELPEDLGGLIELDGEEDLEEIDFDDDGEEEDIDEAESFDEFTKFALGLEEQDEEPLEELDDEFKIEDISTSSLDTSEDMAIMSSEDVANYESPLEEENLKFKDDEPLPEDEDPFGSNEDSSDFAKPEEDFDPLSEIDPFGEEAAALREKEDQKEGSKADGGEEESAEAADGEKPKREKRSRSKTSGANPLAKLAPLAMFPWRVYSKIVSFAFGLLTGLLKILSKLPLIGRIFGMLSSFLNAIPMGAKKVIVLVLIGGLFYGGAATISNLIPKPSATVELPDSGSAKISDVRLNGGTLTAKLENTGEVAVHVVPHVKVAERSFMDPASWFSPRELGSCDGQPEEIAIGAIREISFQCPVEVKGAPRLTVSLSE